MKYVRQKLDQRKWIFFSTLDAKVQTNNKIWKLAKNDSKGHVGLPYLASENGNVTNEQKATTFNYFKSACSSNSPMRISPLPACAAISEQIHDAIWSMNGAFQLLSGLDTAKRRGPDGIANWVLKECAALCGIFFILYVKSLIAEALPDQWKLDHVVPVHKQG